MKVKRIDTLFATKQAALDYLERQKELSPEFLSQEVIEFFEEAIQNVDLTTPPDVPRDDCIIHDARFFLRLKWLNEDLKASSGFESGDFIHRSNEMSVSRELVAFGVDR